MLSRLFSAPFAGTQRLHADRIIRLSQSGGRAWYHPSGLFQRQPNAFKWHQRRNPHNSRWWSRPSFNQSQHRRFGVYRVFARTNFILWWAHSPEFRRFTLILGGCTLCFVGYSMERVPVTGRWRFNFIPRFLLQRRMEALYQQLLEELEEELLTDSAPEVQRLRRIASRLLSSSEGVCDGAKDLSWTLNVTRSDEANAFVLPGPHIFVHTGILRALRDESGRDSDDVLAGLLSHEIAHHIARHGAEVLSGSAALLTSAFLSTMFFNISSSSALDNLDLYYGLPNSRTMEREADYIGLMLMAAANYDPHAALKCWDRMARANPNGEAEYSSTHPSYANRVKHIQGWMGQALKKREANRCEATESVTSPTPS